MQERNQLERVERTTVSLPREVALRLRKEAEREGRSVSGLVREAIEAYLERRSAPRLPSFTATGRSGREDVSERAEELIAGRARRDLRRPT